MADPIVHAASAGKVCHFSSVHMANDIRVFYKECMTLADAGFDTTLIAVSANVPQSAVRVIKLPSEGTRLQRMVGRAYRAYKLALKENAQVYHFHDLELLPYALRLKRKTGAKIIFDSHEFFREDVMSKEWLPKPIRVPVGYAIGKLEDYVARRIDQVVAATPHIAEQFEGVAKRAAVINNYPMLSEFDLDSRNTNAERDGICYVGAISFVRGIIQLLDAISYMDPGVKVHIAGSFAGADVQRVAQTHKNWPRVIFHGQVERSKVVEIYGRCFAGMATLLPSPNHIYSKPIKIFEYMAAGLPVICSNFALWREVVEEGDCGLIVDSAQPEQIGAAVEALRLDPRRRAVMAEHGRMLVRTRYNWGAEGAKLVEIYHDLLAE